jgi:hypothetical protein
MAKTITLFQRSNGIYYVRDQSGGTDKWMSTGKRTKREALAVIQKGPEKPKGDNNGHRPRPIIIEDPRVRPGQLRGQDT